MCRSADPRHPRCHVGRHATERPRVVLATDPQDAQVAILLVASTRVRESLVVVSQCPVKRYVTSVGHVAAQRHLAAFGYILVPRRGVEIKVVLLATFRHRCEVEKEHEKQG